MTTPTSDVAGRYTRLAGFLEQDPANAALLGDTAAAAFAEDRFAEAASLLERLEALAPLDDEALHLAGLAAMRLEQWEIACGRFIALQEKGVDDPAVRFNLAWSLAMAREFDEALALLDDATADALPQAARLQVELLHQQGEFATAGERARALIKRFPEDRALNAATSTLALDIDDMALARRTALAAGDHPAALTTLGTLALGEDDVEVAATLFDEALQRDPRSPRAWVGRGLARLLGDDKATAASEIDRGAELFGDHLGSWIAAGWAWFAAGDIVAAKARFEQALALDDTFAESQGSLAVIDLLEGRIDEGRRRTEIALRLDRQCFSGALASTLLAAGAGDAEKARRILDTAMHTPVDGQGRTVAQALARLAGGSG